MDTAAAFASFSHCVNTGKCALSLCISAGVYTDSPVGTSAFRLQNISTPDRPRGPSSFQPSRGPALGSPGSSPARHVSGIKQPQPSGLASVVRQRARKFSTPSLPGAHQAPAWSASHHLKGLGVGSGFGGSGAELPSSLRSSFCVKEIHFHWGDTEQGC